MTKPNWNTIRDLFPAAKEFVYLATAGAPPISIPASRAGIRYYEEMASQGDLPWDRWLAEVETVRGKTANFIGANPEEIAFTFSSSHGMNLVAQMFGSEGEILTLADEFPSSTLPWLQQRSTMRFIESDPAGLLPMRKIEHAISPETRVIVTSSVQYRTGFYQDLIALGQLCHDRHILLAVDASQSIGAIPLDVHDARIDALVFSGYKWTMAGYGIAVIYLAKQHIQSDRFPIAGWLSARQPELLINNELDLKNTAAALEVGCPNFAGIFSLGAALDLLVKIGPSHIEARIHELTDYLHDALHNRNFEIASPSDRCDRAGITIVVVQNPEEVVKALTQRNILTAARGRGVRVSLHIFNTFEDVDRFVEALEEIKKPEVAR